MAGERNGDRRLALEWGSEMAEGKREKERGGRKRGEGERERGGRKRGEGEIEGRTKERMGRGGRKREWGWEEEKGKASQVRNKIFTAQ